MRRTSMISHLIFTPQNVSTSTWAHMGSVGPSYTFLNSSFLDKVIYQLQLLLSRQALDPRLLTESSRSIGCRPGHGERHRATRSSVFCAPGCAVVLMETSLYIGCDAGVERTISASEDVDVVACHSALTLLVRSLTIRQCGKVNIKFLRLDA